MVTMEELVAQTILQGSDAMYGRFLDVTAGAQERFEQQDWKSVQKALKKRNRFQKCTRKRMSTSLAQPPH